MDGTMGEIRIFAGDFAPKNWAFCQGQLLAISTNSALFSLLGTTYGGNGMQTFALPDLRGRAPVSTGNGGMNGGVQRGEVTGTEQKTMVIQNMPVHSHTAASAVFDVGAGSGKGTAFNSPENNFYNALADTEKNFGNGSLVDMGPVDVNASVVSVGQGQPIPNMQPFIAMNYIICLYGIYPSRQ